MTQTTSYLSYFDQERFSKLHPFRITTSDRDKDAVFANVNHNVYYAMGCDKKDDGAILAAEPFRFRRLLRETLERPGVRFLTALELSRAKPEGGDVLCHIRHDVDADIVSALHLARIERDLGIKSTYYLLHTAPYYGSWLSPDDSGVVLFERNECMAEVYLELQSLGHEVAVHTDALTLYQTHNVDGAAALSAEINWLRSIGLSISGTAPHNSPQVYGAGNSAIFRGRALSATQPAGPQGVVLDGKWAPLGVIDESRIGLSYEADDINERPWIVDFFSIAGPDKWWRNFRHPSLIEETWSAYNRNPKMDVLTFLTERLPEVYPEKSAFWLGHDDIPKRVSQGGAKCVVFSVHPEYYGIREAPDREPTVG